MQFEDIRKHAQDVIGSLAPRDNMFRDLEQIYLLEDMGDLPKSDWIKATRHPDARNAVLGAIRLMTATDPRFSVDEEFNPEGMDSLSSKLERIAGMLWNASGRVSKKPIHYDAVLSGLLYGEVQIAVKSVKQLLEKSPQNKRLEAIYRRTPIIFDVINPASGYPVFDEMGMRSYISSQMRTVGEIRALYGDVEGVVGKKEIDRVRLMEYWDYDQHVVWIDGQTKPLEDEENHWGFIPIICQICEGSELFGTSQFGAGRYQTRHPFLYTLWKSNLVYRQNLSLTLQSSLAFAIGANPLFLYKRNNPSKEAPDIDFSQPGGRVVIDNDEDYAPLVRQVLDNSIMQVDEIYRSLATESTIYKQALGEPLGANAPFSMVALLSQAGRLPLVPYQRTISWAIGEAMQTAFRMMKVVGGSNRISAEGGYIEIDVHEIPDEFEVSAVLDIDLPQDERMNAMIALQLTAGENPLVSMGYARSRYLNIEQPDEEQYKIWNERAAQSRFMMMIQEMIQQQMAAQQQAQQPPAMPPEGMPPEGMPPEAGAEPVGGNPVEEELPDDAPAFMGRAGMGIPAAPMTSPIEPPMESPETNRLTFDGNL